MRTAIYVRLEDPKHAFVSKYAKDHDFTINEVIERLVDQLLIQVEPRFRAPPWLIQAIREGHIALEIPAQGESERPLDEDDDDEGRVVDNVVNWRGAR